MADLAKKLNKERQRAWSEAKAMLETVTSENRSFSGEEEAKWQTLNKHVDTLESRIKELAAGEQRSKDVDAAYNSMAEKRTAPEASRSAQSQFATEMRNLANRQPSEHMVFEGGVPGIHVAPEGRVMS